MPNWRLRLAREVPQRGKPIAAVSHGMSGAYRRHVFAVGNSGGIIGQIGKKPSGGLLNSADGIWNLENNAVGFVEMAVFDLKMENWTLIKKHPRNILAMMRGIKDVTQHNRLAAVHERLGIDQGFVEVAERK